MKQKNILIVGVGGQGTLLASKILGKLFMQASYDVKVSEVHGMAQRGGSVVTYVKAGESISSPVIDIGEADIVISFELLESARWLQYLKTGGTLVTNTQKIPPMTVNSGLMEYPQGIEAELDALGIKTIYIDAESIALTAGNIKAVNMALLGAASGLFEFDEAVWIDMIKKSVPEKTVAVNFEAFKNGRSSVLSR